MYYGFIYEWTNILNGKKYIGSHAGTVDDGYTGSGKVFKWAIKKYGIENFTRSILEYIDIDDRYYLLEREKFYLDAVNAYYSDNYYNVAKDVIGGDTRAGWSDERRQKFRQQIRDIWASRTSEEKHNILEKSHSKLRELYNTPAGEELKKDQRARFYKNKDKIIDGVRNISYNDKRRAGRLGKERMGENRRKEAAKKGVENRNPETEILARKKAKETRTNWSEEKRKKVFENSSCGRKDKCVGAANGRARKIVAGGIAFDTLKDAMLHLGISEGTLYKRLKDLTNKDYYYVGTGYI